MMAVAVKTLILTALMVGNVGAAMAEGQRQAPLDEPAPAPSTQVDSPEYNAEKKILAEKMAVRRAQMTDAEKAAEAAAEKEQAKIYKARFEAEQEHRSAREAERTAREEAQRLKEEEARKYSVKNCVTFGAAEMQLRLDEQTNRCDDNSKLVWKIPTTNSCDRPVAVGVEVSGFDKEHFPTDISSNNQRFVRPGADFVTGDVYMGNESGDANKVFKKEGILRFEVADQNRHGDDEQPAFLTEVPMSKAKVVKN